MTGILAFEAFAARVVRELDIDTARCGDSVAELECLALDSVQWFELVLVLDALGTEVAEDEILKWSTLGDAYRSYALAAALGTRNYR